MHDLPDYGYPSRRTYGGICCINVDADADADENVECTDEYWAEN